MREVVLVVVSVGLTAFFGQTFGPRRMVRNLHEQLQVLNDLPKDMTTEIERSKQLIAADHSRYYEARNKNRFSESYIGRFGFAFGVAYLLATIVSANPGLVPNTNDTTVTDAVAVIEVVLTILITVTFGGCSSRRPARFPQASRTSRQATRS